MIKIRQLTRITIKFTLVKMFHLITITTAKVMSLEETLEELSENGIIGLYVDNDLKQPNRKAKQSKM